eukprot:scaffold50475_cov21-Tisochrysis_lutea.AAC.1
MEFKRTTNKPSCGPVVVCTGVSDAKIQNIYLILLAAVCITYADGPAKEVEEDENEEEEEAGEENALAGTKGHKKANQSGRGAQRRVLCHRKCDKQVQSHRTLLRNGWVLGWLGGCKQ